VLKNISFMAKDNYILNIDQARASACLTRTSDGDFIKITPQQYLVSN